MKKHIPNFLTLMNLVSGITAIVFLASENIVMASYLIIIASVFDLLDGMVARLLKVSSPLGVQLDSLSDLVSFGVVPGLMVYTILNGSLTFPVLNSFALSGFMIPLFAAIRLGKFNLTGHNQKDYFIGVPVPLSAWFFISLPLIVNEYTATWLYEPLLLSVLVLLFSILMVSRIPVVSLKFKNFSFRDNRLRYILILSGIIAALLLHFAVVPVIILLTLFSTFFIKTR
jgi:CDP-diacylglycerol--serine O-phosphatidyltransferase